MTWRQQAKCLGTFDPVFFLDKGQTSRRAKAICRTCPVTEQCLDYAMTSRQYYGVWGGLTSMERIKVRRRRAA